LRFPLGIAAAVLAVLVAGQGLADDSSGGAEGVVLEVGGAAQAPAAESGVEGTGSMWTDLRGLLSETTVRIGATSRDPDPAVDVDDGYSAYAAIDFAGFTIGSRFARWGEPTATGGTKQSFGFGASYRLDSWTIGLDWARGGYDEIFLDVGSGEADDIIAFTSSYDLRPGVQINGLLEYSEDRPASDRPTEGAITVGIGTLISF
jgi:predicted porin